MRAASRGRRRQLLAGLTLAAGGFAAAQSATAQARMLPDTLDIGRAVQIALTESPTLRMTQAQADQAGAARLAAWGAFLPTAGGTMNLGRNTRNVGTYEAEEGPAERLAERLSYTSQSASQSFGLNLTLLEGGRRFAELRGASAGVRAAQRRLDDQQRQVIVSVRREFLDALRRQELLELTRSQIADRELELDIAQRRYEIAAVERTDVLAAESGVLNARIRLIAEQNQLEAGLQRLVVSMGLPPDASDGLVLTGDEGMPVGLPDVDLIVRTALSSDPELAALEADRSAASAALWAARTNYLPTITAFLNWGRSESFGPDASFWQFRPGDTGQSFGVSVSWNIFNGFLREQQHAQASSQRRQAEEDLRRRRLEIERDVRQFGADIQRLAESLELLERDYAISRERLEMEQERYRNGTGSFIGLQQAVQAVQGAEISLIQSEYDYLIAWSNLAEYVEAGPGTP
ncbi:TolC family protein [Candidatus Palauibacter sp.]|uniref:TolC family protein n=1 Tax=Candidatus Palauibacter sp. TaxID=3101350 RepID=UPI003B020EC2